MKEDYRIHGYVDLTGETVLEGEVYITWDANRELCHEDVLLALNRHAVGDWGDCSSLDRNKNELAVGTDRQLFSVYYDRNGVEFWVLTEQDDDVPITSVFLANGGLNRR